MNRPGRAFSVLLPVYASEQPDHFHTALNSVFEQTTAPDEVVIVKDGPLPPALDAVIDDFSQQHPGRIRAVALKEHVGLGAALATGVEACRHELIARMDSDDICCPERFEKQLAAFADSEKLDIVGGQTVEFVDTVDHPAGKRSVPLNHAAILKYTRLRNPFNHMSVMFKKSSVLAAGNYQPMPGAEDYWLWGRMFVNGCIGQNLPECLVLARANRSFYGKRHGWQYMKNMFAVRRSIHRLGLSTWFECFWSCAGLCVVSLLPLALKRRLYRSYLRQ